MIIIVAIITGICVGIRRILMWYNIYIKLTLYIVLRRIKDFQENYTANLSSVNPNYK